MPCHALSKCSRLAPKNSTTSCTARSRSARPARSPPLNLPPHSSRTGRSKALKCNLQGRNRGTLGIVDVQHAAPFAYLFKSVWQGLKRSTALAALGLGYAKQAAGLPGCFFVDAVMRAHKAAIGKAVCGLHKPCGPGCCAGQPPVRSSSPTLQDHPS